MNIPLFPDMRPVVLGDKDLFDRLFREYPPQVSEFTFTNIFAWRRSYRFCVSCLNDCVLIISAKDTRSLDIFDPVGRPAQKKSVVEEVFSSTAGCAKFIRVPEATAGLFMGRDGISVEEDRDNFDYVYSARDLIELRGRDFDAKRNFIRRFKESHQFKYEKITGANLEKCLSFEEEWCLVKDCQHVEGLTAERGAAREMLAHIEDLGVCGGIIEINGKVEAVALGEELNPETFVVHVEKANGSYAGINQAISQIFVSNEAGRYLYVNREQDLGVPGLRKAKESYHPHHMVKKYVLRPKS